MNDLIEFLRDRLDEDETAGRTVTDEQVQEQLGWAEVSVEGASEHIERYMPSRIQAEIHAKQRILDLYDAATSDVVRDAVGVDSQDGAVSAVTAVVQNLAAVYADHPDYNQAWRP